MRKIFLQNERYSIVTILHYVVFSVLTASIVMFFMTLLSRSMSLIMVSLVVSTFLFGVFNETVDMVFHNLSFHPPLKTFFKFKLRNVISVITITSFVYFFSAMIYLVEKNVSDLTPQQKLDNWMYFHFINEKITFKDFVLIEPLLRDPLSSEEFYRELDSGSIRYIDLDRKKMTANRLYFYLKFGKPSKESLVYIFNEFDSGSFDLRFKGINSSSYKYIESKNGQDRWGEALRLAQKIWFDNNNSIDTDHETLFVNIKNLKLPTNRSPSSNPR